MDNYTEWCAAVDLDPEDDSSRNAYDEAGVAESEQNMLEINLDLERFAMETGDPDWLDVADWSAVEQGFYDDDPNPYHGDYSEM